MICNSTMSMSLSRENRRNTRAPFSRSNPYPASCSAKPVTKVSNNDRMLVTTLPQLSRLAGRLVCSDESP